MANLVVKGLCKRFETAAEQLDVLEDVDLTLSPGENMSIVGPSGCGKSTLLYILGTLDQPTSGVVEIGETDPFSLPTSKLAVFRNESVGFVFQDHHLLPQLTVTENILLPTLALGRPKAEQRQRCTELIEAVGLTDRADHLPAQLSGGQRQRVAVARALVNRPQLVLADEPTGNLDEDNTKRIAELIFQLQGKEDASLIVVTHSPWLAAQAGRQARIENKRLMEKEGATV